jgi:hypothetical protein
MGRDNSMDDGQAQASSLSDIFRREEWGEYFLKNLSVHASACVFDHERDVIFIMKRPQGEPSA